jgi:hypothetical protein
VYGWTADGKLYVQRDAISVLPMRVVVLDLATGKGVPWRDVVPDDATGVNAVNALRVADGGAYAYNYYRILSSLFLVEGLK